MFINQVIRIKQWKYQKDEDVACELSLITLLILEKLIYLKLYNYIINGRYYGL